MVSFLFLSSILNKLEISATHYFLPLCVCARLCRGVRFETFVGYGRGSRGFHGFHLELVGLQENGEEDYFTRIQLWWSQMVSLPFSISSTI